MRKLWSDPAWEDFVQWLDEDRKTAKRIVALIKDIDREGYNGIGKPEPLKGDLSGYWNRHINKKDRLVYRIEDDVIEIYQCSSHYGEK